MELWVGQLLSAIGLFVLTFIFCIIIPSYVVHKQKGFLLKNCKDLEKVSLLDNPELNENPAESSLEAVSITQHSTRNNVFPTVNENNNNNIFKVSVIYKCL